MTLTPAYGRDYKSQKAVRADFDADKDFIIADIMHPDCGRYVNKTQLTAEQSVNVRYAELAKVMVIQL